jgi:hypothetical protein
MTRNMTTAGPASRARRAATALAVLAAVASAMTVMASVPAGAANTPQVTFSVTTATFDLSAGGTSHFGFWVWCDAGSASAYGDCRGSIYFYSLAPNAVPVTGSVRPQGAGAYFMTVTSPPSRGFPAGVACTLTNTPPVTNGPANEVTATCTTPAGTGTALNAVVAVSKALHGQS